ncbi:MAG: sucrose phosphorylase, partial [Gammaproteobacteria bacterium]|nr:sucrose phosphorylase [Gammaproteobacteria bacterium]
DAGFDPIDHTRVDPRLGDWNDIASLAAEYTLMADLIVNHVSVDSPQFQDVRRNGKKSPYWDLFLRKGDVFPGGETASAIEAEVKRIYRPRPGLPFTPIALDDGASHDFWTTFSAKQLDINVEVPAGRAYLDSILNRFAHSGVREIRLDAAGYAIKRRGSQCFMLPETFSFIAALSEQARTLGIDTLVEIHSYYQTQVAIASQVGRVYDFALPPLILHTLFCGNASALKKWLDIAPRNCVTVLDTHDGIGIIDVARQGDVEGLLADAEIDTLVETIHDNTNGASRRASGVGASNLDIYQVNSTYYDALGRDDDAYLVARAIQFFAPGTPQVYYVGLLAGENDMKLVGRTGVGRDINRHYYAPDEIHEALQRPVVRQLMDLIRLRNKLPVFDGKFSIPESRHDLLCLRWDRDDAYAELRVDLEKTCARISYSVAATSGSFDIGDTAHLNKADTT